MNSATVAGGERIPPPLLPQSTAEEPQSPVVQENFASATEVAQWVRAHTWPDQPEGTGRISRSPGLRGKPAGESGGEPGFGKTTGHMMSLQLFTIVNVVALVPALRIQNDYY